MTYTAFMPFSKAMQKHAPVMQHLSSTSSECASSRADEQAPEERGSIDFDLPSR